MTLRITYGALRNTPWTLRNAPGTLRNRPGTLHNALLWSQVVLGWVQRNLNFGSSDRRLKQTPTKFTGRALQWPNSC